MFSCVWLFVTLWIAIHQSPLSTEFSQQEYWSRLPFPSPGIFLTQGLDPHLLRLLHWQESQQVSLKCEVFHTSLDSALGPSHQFQMSRKIMNIIPLLGRSSGGGYGNPLQYSRLENPIDRGVWWATVHRVTKSWTRLKQLSMNRALTCSIILYHMYLPWFLFLCKWI